MKYFLDPFEKNRKNQQKPNRVPIVNVTVIMNYFQDKTSFPQFYKTLEIS